MNILEKDLEEIIAKTDVSKLNEKGLLVNGKCYQQPKFGSYGIADLVYVYKDYDVIDLPDKSYKLEPYLYIQVCELKKDKAGISAFLQAVRYCKGISRYLKKRNFNNYKFEIVLIAPNIDIQSDYIFLTDLISSDLKGSINCVSNYSVDYGFNGISFNKEFNYNIIEENFKTLK